MKKKLKLKTWVWVLLVLILFGSIGTYAGIKIYKNYQYEQTYEYKLQNIGYSKEETEKILNVFTTDEERNFFLNNQKEQKYLDFLNEPYFLKEHFQEYLDYAINNSKLTTKEVVRNINIHLDHPFYDDLGLKTDVSKDYLMLVNKYYLLDGTYAPDDLVVIPQTYAWGEAGSRSCRKVAFDAFEEMWQGAKEAGYYLMISSAYRTYQDQETIYNNYKENRGRKYADSIAARPGSSEHQTGLALDIFSKANSNQATFKDTPEANWLKDNAYKYGFILRYPEDKVDLTGYNFEAWHYRYIGVEAATYCYEHDLTFEEYYAYFLEK